MHRGVGIGCAGISLFDPPPLDEAVRPICAALDAGVRVVDAAKAYVPDVESAGFSEALAAAAVREWGGDRASVVIATKGGHGRVGNGFAADDFEIDARPDALRADCDASLRALGTDVIDLYLLHWPDPNVPWSDSVGAVAELRDAGKVRMIGVSNVSVEQLDEASAVTRIDAVQNRFSLLAQESRPVVDRCSELGAVFMAYSPLGGMGRAAKLTDRVPALATIAESRAVSPQRVALAWVLHQSDAVVAIAGCRRIESAVDSAAAADLELSEEELELLTSP